MINESGLELQDKIAFMDLNCNIFQRFCAFCSHGSKTIPSPFHLSWLALILYLELFPEAIEEVGMSLHLYLLQCTVFIYAA